MHDCTDPRCMAKAMAGNKHSDISCFSIHEVFNTAPFARAYTHERKSSTLRPIDNLADVAGNHIVRIFKSEPTIVADSGSS